MKRNIIIQILLFINPLLFSQTLNYTETVKYITSKLKTYNQRAVDYKCEINQYGVISEELKSFGGKGEIVRSSVNINDIGKIELVKSVVEPNQYFIYFYCKSNNCAYVYGNSSKIFDILFEASEVDAQRLLKAFLHLQELAKNIKDPFD